MKNDVPQKEGDSPLEYFKKISLYFVFSNAIFRIEILYVACVDEIHFGAFAYIETQDINIHVHIHINFTMYKDIFFFVIESVCNEDIICYVCDIEGRQAS